MSTQKYFYKGRDLLKLRSFIFQLLVTCIFVAAGLLVVFISSAYSLGWDDKEWAQSGRPDTVLGKWIPDNPATTKLKILSIKKGSVEYAYSANSILQFGIVENSVVTGSRYTEMKLTPLNRKSGGDTTIKIRPHIIYIDSKNPENRPRCLIKIFKFSTEKHALTGRYLGWGIFQFIEQ